jgi:pantothenate kinase type III
MLLTVDIGNTRTKAAVFEPNGQLVVSFTLQGNEIDELQKWFRPIPFSMSLVHQQDQENGK